MAPPYSRAALPPGVGDQVLAPNMLPDMYPPLPHSFLEHRGLPVAGHGAVAADLAMAGYQHHATELGQARLGRVGDALPDIVHSHNVMHARPNQHRSGANAAAVASRHQRQRQQNRGQGRSREGRERSGRSGQQRRRSRTQSTTTTQTDSGRCKEPCVKCIVAVTSLRSVLLMLSMLGVLFVVSGIIMAALHAIGNDFLIYALIFIGLGVVLVVVVIVAWKCSPPGSEPIHVLFNIGDSQSRHRERRPRRTRRARDGQWHGGMMYPEFQYRRPPPTYADSMQAYQQAQATDAQFNNNTISLVNNSDSYSLPGSPPPSYRSRASTIHSGVHITFPPGHDSAPNSRPPTYRSRAESHQRPRLPMDDMEAFSSGGAPEDVSFAGPVMTAAAVQQIIGTHHRRQQSAGAAMHRRSASLDLAQGSDVVHHRRGSSLDRGSTGGALGINSQGTLTPLRQSGDVPLMAELTVRLSAESTGARPVHSPVQEATRHGEAEMTQDITQSPSSGDPSRQLLYGSNTSTGQAEAAGAVGDNADTTNNAQSSKSEQYNTAL